MNLRKKSLDNNLQKLEIAAVYPTYNFFVRQVFVIFDKIFTHYRSAIVFLANYNTLLYPKSQAKNYNFLNFLPKCEIKPIFFVICYISAIFFSSLVTYAAVTNEASPLHITRTVPSATSTLAASFVNSLLTPKGNPYESSAFSRG